MRGTLHDYHITRTELDALKGERTGHVALASMDSLFIGSGCSRMTTDVDSGAAFATRVAYGSVLKPTGRLAP